MIICAPDSFKESMTAAEAAAAMERGIRRVLPNAEVALVPLADGGEGTCAALHSALGGELIKVPSHDGLGREIEAEFLYVSERKLAVVEMAAAAGLELLSPGERDARVTTTFGVGELIREALDHGAAELLVGLGGSATNDAGVGMLTALGARFLDADAVELEPGGQALARLASIDLTGFDRRLADVKVVIASDVTNPLLGPNGASHVFGSQKGADPATVEQLDDALTRWADIAEATMDRSVREQAGAGAAGGLGAALLAFTNATIQPGADFVMDQVGIDAMLERADLVLTGEGSWDAQSAAGKAPAAVAARAAAKGVPTVVFAGRVQEPEGGLQPEGVITAVPIVREVCDLCRALSEGPANLQLAVAATMQLLTALPRSTPWTGHQL